MGELGLVVAGRLRDGVDWVEEDPASNRWTVVSFAEALVEIGLIAVLCLG